jgi:trehalose 6-phosphate synthase
MAQLVLASNRGPVSFVEQEDGTVATRRGGGGLVSALGSLRTEELGEALWVCAALTDADRAVAQRADAGRLDRLGVDAGNVPVRMLPVAADTLSRAYNSIANSTLWFVHHLLYDVPVAPVFDAAWRKDWRAFETYNDEFVEAIAQEADLGARVLVQDYHLPLVPSRLRARRPDLRVAHFSHTPWAPPDYFHILPQDVARAVLTGILGADRAGFLSPRWAQAFLDCARTLPGARVDVEAGTVLLDGHETRVDVHPLGVDPRPLRARAAQDDVRRNAAALREQIGNRKVVSRVDRTELSKNIVRGLLAFAELLREYPQWRGRVVHVAYAYPSRYDLRAYRDYTAQVQRTAEQINEEFGTPDWQPVLLGVEDDYARSLAAYVVADVVLVNPVRDGMNLVAKEAPLLAEHGCALVLSTEAGAADELGEAAFLVNPYDVTATAAALDAALCLDDTERARRTGLLVEAACALPPGRWLAAQVKSLAAVKTGGGEDRRR